MLTCPNCNTRIHLRATVDAFNEPPEWEFWGKPGEQWTVCKGAGYVHFRVLVNGFKNERLAVVRK